MGKTKKNRPDDSGEYWLGIAIIVVIIIGLLFAVVYEPLAAHFGWPT